MNGFYWIYLVMFGLMLWYHFADTQEQRRLIYYGACAFLVVMFVAQDYSVSIDIAEYMRQYDIIPTLTLPEMLVHKFEIGYVLLSRLASTLFASDRVLLLLLSVLLMVPFCRSFEKENEAPMIALMAFVALGMYLHAIIFWRQLVAMAILTYSFRYIRERRLIPFLVILLIAMSFHKVSVVFLGMYIVYNIPIRKWLLVLCGGLSLVFWLFGKQIIDLGIKYIYPLYINFPRLQIGGYNLYIVMWILTLLSYWLLKDRMQEGRIRLPFLMVLIAATIHPVCFDFYNWFRVVLFYRIGLVPLTAELYSELFCHKDNKFMVLLEKRLPKLHGAVLSVYDTKWFQAAAQVMLFTVLFIWYLTELEDAVYIMAPIR